MTISPEIRQHRALVRSLSLQAPILFIHSPRSMDICLAWSGALDPRGLVSRAGAHRASSELWMITMNEHQGRSDARMGRYVQFCQYCPPQN